MHGVKDIIRDAESLPAEDRIAVIDSLLRTLNRTSPEIDAEWIKIAKTRLAELRSGKVTPIPGYEVFAKIKKRFDK
ncbi:MAG TPA: addiction module protein [Candidatus Rifleibacterium sp.]|nr:addiction module protein [Candidatus Rifleibacterium sp.]